MNQILREFEKQSGLEIYGLGTRRVKWEAAMERFAELIVRECIEQLNISNVPAPISAGLNLGRVAIKEHFGVEE